MKWIRITDDLQIGIERGRPKHYSREGLSLEQVVEQVRVWVRTDPRAEVWLEVAEEELDLQKRMQRRREDLDLWIRLFGGERGEITDEEERRNAIRDRDFERGEEALKKRDYDEALARLLPLAESGYAPAQVWIGGMFAKGLGVALDSVQAYVWLDLAARAGVGRATKWRAEIAERLSADELGEAQRRAADWIPKRPADQEAD